MRTNGDLTLYKRSGSSWTRSVVVGVCWERRHGFVYSPDGAIQRDGIVVYIPKTHYPTSGINVGDVIVRNNVADVIGASFSIADLRAKYSESATVKAVDTMDLASPVLQHYQIEGE